MGGNYDGVMELLVELSNSTFDYIMAEVKKRRAIREIEISEEKFAALQRNANIGAKQFTSQLQKSQVFVKENTNDECKKGSSK